MRGAEDDVHVDGSAVREMFRGMRTTPPMGPRLSACHQKRERMSMTEWNVREVVGNDTDMHCSHIAGDANHLPHACTEDGEWSSLFATQNST